MSKKKIGAVPYRTAPYFFLVAYELLSAVDFELLPTIIGYSAYYSTVTLFARFLGLSISQFLSLAT